MRAVAVRGHRFLIVLATTILAVGGSRVANAPLSLPDWLITIGGGLGLYIADAAREIDEAIRQLPEGKGDLRKRTVDGMLTSRGRWIPLGLLIASVATAGGLAYSVLDAIGRQP